MKTTLWLLLLAICLTLSLGGCGTVPTPTPPPAGETPLAAAPTPASTQPSKKRCGDGVCDGPENANNCPEDCAEAPSQPDEQPTATLTPTPTPNYTPIPDEEASAPPGDTGGADPSDDANDPGEGPPPDDGEPPDDPGEGEPSGDPGASPSEHEWYGHTIWNCQVRGPASAYDWTLYYDFEFSVGSDGSLSGSGEGDFTFATCSQEGCTCDLTVGPFAVQVSGTQEDSAFALHLEPANNMVETLCCPELGCESAELFQIWACRAEGTIPIDVTIEAEDDTVLEFDGPGLGPEWHADGLVRIFRR